MAKKPTTDNLQNAEQALAELVKEKSRLEEVLAKLASDRSALDPLAADSLRRRGAIITDEAGASAALGAIGPAIDAAEAIVRDLKEAARDEKIVALRAEDAEAMKAVVSATRTLYDVLERWTMIDNQLRALGSSSWSGGVGLLIQGVRSALAVWRERCPEAIGLPARPSREETLRSDAVLQAEHIVGRWSDVRQQIEKTKSSHARGRLQKRLKDLVAPAHAAFSRCQAVGAVAPSAPRELLQAISVMLERDAAQDLAEHQLLHPDVDGGDSAVRLLDLADLRRQRAGRG